MSHVDSFMTTLDCNLLPVNDVSETVFVLVDMYDTAEEGFDGEWYVARLRRVHKTLVMAHEMQLGTTVGVYVKLSDVTMHSPQLYKICGAVLVKNLRHEFSFSKGVTWYDDIATTERDKKRQYMYSNVKSNEKITQWHHLHVRLRDLFPDEVTTLYGSEALLAKCLDELNDNEATHATFWTYVKSVDKKSLAIFYGMLNFYGSIDNTWLKNEGMWAKQLQSVVAIDFSSIFELNVLVNRVTTQVNWDKERINREQPTLADFSYDDVFKHCYRLFGDARAEGKRAFKYSFEQYWRQRVVLMPGGSVHSEQYGDKKIAKSLPRELKNKKGFFSSINDSSHENWLNRDAEIHSYTSTKYEWGKVRALYGCDVSSHLHADFSMNKCEETFPSYIPTGSRANSDYVAHAAKNLQHLIPFCYDYDDFNSQHSFSSMQAAIAAWLKVYGSDLTDEQVRSVKWTLASVREQYVHNSFSQENYKTAGTLFSGWRLTTFINTALNYAYLAASGLRECVAYSLHNGDDVYAAVRKMSDIPKLIANTKMHNIRAQATKMNIGTIAEFLRMDFNAAVPTAKQYLTRGCATFVHSRIESDAPNAQRSLYRAIKTRGSEVIDRGGDQAFITGLMKKQFTFCSQLFSTQDFSAWLEKYDLIAGGWNETFIVDGTEVIDEVMATSEEVNMASIRPGMQDFITYICDLMPTMRNKSNVEQLEKTLKNSFNTRRTKLTSAQSSKQEQTLLMSLRHVWKNLPKLGAFSKARMTSADMLAALAAASPKHAGVIQKSHNPYKYLSVML